MWCIGRITAEYRERMYDVLALYANTVGQMGVTTYTAVAVVSAGPFIYHLDVQQ